MRQVCIHRVRSDLYHLAVATPWLSLATMPVRTTSPVLVYLLGPGDRIPTSRLGPGPASLVSKHLRLLERESVRQFSSLARKRFPVEVRLTYLPPVDTKLSLSTAQDWFASFWEMRPPG